MAAAMACCLVRACVEHCQEVGMPKTGMQVVRKDALVRATIDEIGLAGNLDVTVAQIARRAGVSSALAHHYFGGKDDILFAAMRAILQDFRAIVVEKLGQARSPRARVIAILEASFSDECFAPETVNAWMVLYANAPQHGASMHLLSLYHKRLKSNLVHALRSLTVAPEADADMLAAMIDGLYLRTAVARGMRRAEAAKLLERTLDGMIRGAA
jgi:TetR/AcrR family transcriptional repressor of bet genes